VKDVLTRIVVITVMVFLVIPGLVLEVFEISRLSFAIIQSFISKTFKV
jgi:hypothetical protein